MRPQLYQLLEFKISGRRPKSVRDKHVVFVHGIRSSHETFEPLVELLRAKGLEVDHALWYFDYNYRLRIAENGRYLARELKNFMKPEDEVTIVGHSMGGLVSRLALLQEGDKMKFVKRLVMLGTPNHGTLHTGRLGNMAQLTREVTGKLWALMVSKTGVLELTQINKVMDEFLDDRSQARTDHVEYISIPATCFNETSGWLELLTSGGASMATVPLAMELITAHPGWRIGLRQPHDGIVEESSVFMGNRADSNRRSERLATCRGTGTAPYVHIRHPKFRKESHVTIQRAEQTAEIIAELLKPTDLQQWRAKYGKSSVYDFEPGK